MIKILCLLLLIPVLPVAADASQVGRINSEVIFRKGPDRSAPVISRLPAGTEVEIIKLDPAGWYFIAYRGRPGYVHKNYITLGQHQNPVYSSDLWNSGLARRAGMILTGVGIVLIASVLAPDLILIATAMGIAIAVAAILDVLFQVGKQHAAKKKSRKSDQNL